MFESRSSTLREPGGRATGAAAPLVALALCFGALVLCKGEGQ